MTMAGWRCWPRSPPAPLMGLISGLVQTMLRIPSFMATLGMWFIGLGFSVFMLGGSAIRLMTARSARWR